MGLFCNILDLRNWFCRVLGGIGIRGPVLEWITDGNWKKTSFGCIFQERLSEHQVFGQVDQWFPWAMTRLPAYCH